jgi:hypothetical protein
MRSGTVKSQGRQTMRLLIDTNTFRHPAASCWEHQEDQLIMFGPWLIAHRRFKWRPKPQSEGVMREIPFVPALGMAGAQHNMEFFTYQLLKLESWTVRPPRDWAGRLIPQLFDLKELRTRHDYNGIIIGGDISLKQRIQRHVNGIKDPRFLELVKVLGPKGSQDALHILICEQHGLDGFVTLDGRLKRKFEQARAKLRSRVRILFPSEVCCEVGIEPVEVDWFEEALGSNNLVQLFQRKATWRDRCLYACYRTLMRVRDRYGVKVKFVLPGY